MQNNSFFNNKMLSYNATAEGRALYSSYYHTVLHTFPLFLDEVRGMADGAKISFSMLFLWNMVFEWESLLDPMSPSTPPSCSDLYLVNQDHVLMGHNEDGSKIDISNTYLIKARITEPQTTNTAMASSRPMQEFTAFCYPGELCGNAFGFNIETGLVSTVNSVFPKNINTAAVPYNYLTRLSLSADYEQLMSTLNSVPCSSGFSLNVGHLGSLAVANVEVWPGGVSVFNVSGYNYHFNMYRHSDPEQYVDPSSEHRLARVKQLAPPTDSADILSILGDTWDRQYPIYRTGVPTDFYFTLTTALFDLKGKKLYLFRENPTNDQPSNTIPLH